MNIKKKIIAGEYILLALLSVLTIFLPYMKIDFSLDFLVHIERTVSLTGWKLMMGLSALKEVTDSDLVKYMDVLREESIFFTILIIVGMVTPIILMIIDLILHVVYLVRDRCSRLASIFPGLAVAFMTAVQIILAVEIHNKAKKLPDAITLRVRPQVGVILFVVIGLVNLIQNLVLSSGFGEEDGNGLPARGTFRDGSRFKKGQPAKVAAHAGAASSGSSDRHSKHSSGGSGGSAGRRGKGDIRDLKNHTVTSWTNSDLFARHPERRGGRPDPGGVEAGGGSFDPVYTARPPQIQQAADRHGMILGIAGQYRGAQIMIKNGEWLDIGRSPGNSLILSSPMVSRRHCRVSYDGVENRYILINESLNGTFLSSGEQLTDGQVYYLPRGAVFQVAREDAFQLL